MDLVYIVREGERNEDLRYSLRSVSKFVPHDKIWIVGYKPSWVQNVEYLPVKQTENKWKNSVKNIIEACKCEEISENFILMNDDFFAIKPIKDLEESVNLSLGNIESEVKRYEEKNHNSNWAKAFKYVVELLESLNIPKPYYNYESHTPLLINRKKYLEIMNYKEVQLFIKSSKILHKRSLYKNIIKPENQTFLLFDNKVSERIDDTPKRIKICDWISVFDNQVGNKNFPLLNNLLRNLFSEPCKYEVPQQKPKPSMQQIKYKKSKNFYTF